MKTNKVKLMCLLGAAAGPAVASSAVADVGAQGGWNHHGMMWGGGAGWFIGPIMMLLFLVAAVAVVVLAVRWLGGADGARPRAGQKATTSAQEILEERFARGEIDEEEFRQRKQALKE